VETNSGQVINDIIIELHEIARENEDTRLRIIADTLHTLIKENRHLSLQKTQSGELVAVTYTDDEYRITDVLWQKDAI
jgi:hypothetical protein